MIIENMEGGKSVGGAGEVTTPPTKRQLQLCAYVSNYLYVIRWPVVIIAAI